MAELEEGSGGGDISVRETEDWALGGDYGESRIAPLKPGLECVFPGKRRVILQEKRWPNERETDSSMREKKDSD